MSRYTFIDSRPARGGNRVLAVLLVLSVGLNLFLLFFDRPSGDDDDAAAQTGDQAQEPGEGVGVPVDGTTDPVLQPPPPAEIGEFTNLQAIDVQVSGSLSQTVDQAVEGRRGVWVTATAGRVLVWCMDMQKDLRKGDRLRVLFQPEGDEEVHIAALTYDSDKHKTRYRAYYLTPQGEQWGSFFDPDGREIPARLTDKVLADYEQITALLGDGRDHKGVDFMTPLGTAVYSPKDATVLRTTWNFKYNGNSLELRFGDGTIARYLHLQKVADGLAPGGKVKAGQQIAASGNTGRTNAPHLHYELEQGGRVVDPFEYHASTHRQLEGAELERLHEVIELYERAMDTAPATAGDGDEATAVPDDQSAPTT